MLEIEAALRIFIAAILLLLAVLGTQDLNLVKRFKEREREPSVAALPVSCLLIFLLPVLMIALAITPGDGQV